MSGHRKTKTIILSVILWITASCSNVFTRYLAETDTDRALLYEAQMLMDKKRYAEAQSLLLRMSSAFFAQREVQVLYASTFAGQCGLDAISLALNLSEGSSQTLFQILLSAFRAPSATTLTNCIQAETTLAAVIDTQSGTVDEHFLMIFIALAKIGAILSFSADALDQNGVLDAGFNKCTNANLTDLRVAHVTTGLARVITSLAATGSTLSGLPNSSIDSLCAVVDGLPGIPSPCGMLNVATVQADAALLRVMRVLIASNEIGLAACNNTLQSCLGTEPCP